MAPKVAPPPPPPPPPCASLAIAAAPNAAATSLAATSQSRAALCANFSALARDRRAPTLRKSASDDAPADLTAFNNLGTCDVSISSHRLITRSKSPRAIASSHDAAHRSASAHARTASMASFVERSSAMARSNSSSDRSNAPPAFATASSCALAAVPRRRMPSLTPSSSRMARVNDAWCSPQIRSTASAFSRRTHSSASTAAAPEAPTCAPEMTPAAPRASAKCTSGAASSSGRERSSPSDPFVDAACASRMARISSAMRRSAGDGRFAVPSASSSSSPPAASCASLAAAALAFAAAPSLAALASSSVGFASASSASSCSHRAMVSITNHSCAHCCADMAPSRSTSSLLSQRSRASTVSGRMPPSRTVMRSAMGRARSRRVRRMRRAAPFAFHFELAVATTREFGKRNKSKATTTRADRRGA